MQENKFIVIMFISMILLGVLCGVVFYYMFMYAGGILILHCILVGILFGLINSFTALFFMKKNSNIESDNKKLEQQMRVDNLTKLYNRYAFDIDIKNLNPEDQCSMIFIDIDNFRSFNNNHGHHVGDKVLTSCAEIIRRIIRFSDMVYRYGGEEIVIILEKCSKAEAERIGRDIVESIHNYDNAPFPMITVSAGVATIPDDTVSIDQLIKLSDLALLRAKKLGKNQVVSSNCLSVG